MKSKLNYPTLDEVKAKLHEMVDSVAKREYNDSVFYGLNWADNTPPTGQIGDVVGQFDITFKRLRASDSIAQAATAESLATKAKTLSAEQRKQLAESLLADL